MNKNMRKMYSEQDIAEIVEKVTSVEYLKEHAVDITGLPETGSMEVETYANVINRALKSKCVKLNGICYFINLSQSDESTGKWAGGYSGVNISTVDSAQLLYIFVDKTTKDYQIMVGEL